jgi:alkylhydroperoxidase family enzyme
VLGLTEEQMAHLLDDPLPEGVYAPEEAAIIRYAQKSTRLEPIDDRTYGDLAAHFSPQQIIDLCLIIGISNMINRFHATFQTDVDASTLAEVEAGNATPGVCPIPLPGQPAG